MLFSQTKATELVSSDSVAFHLFLQMMGMQPLQQKTQMTQIKVVETNQDIHYENRTVFFQLPTSPK
jgi:hypothetical protein